MVATLLTLVFLPALYVAWFRIKPESSIEISSIETSSIETIETTGAPALTNA